MREIIFNTDDEVHGAGTADCVACSEGYPVKHECGGLLHASPRFDMEAGFTWEYTITRCDGCEYRGQAEKKAT